MKQQPSTPPRRRHLNHPSLWSSLHSVCHCWHDEETPNHSTAYPHIDNIFCNSKPVLKKLSSITRQRNSVIRNNNDNSVGFSLHSCVFYVVIVIFGNIYVRSKIYLFFISDPDFISTHFVSNVICIGLGELLLRNSDGLGSSHHSRYHMLS